MAKLKINRGTTYPITFAYAKNGVAASLTGATVYFTAKSLEYDTSATDATAIISKTVTNHTDPANGITVIPLTATDTAYVSGVTTFITPGDYTYDIKVKEASGNVYKAAEGTLSIDGSPTNRAL